jgi:hypothetical protein
MSEQQKKLSATQVQEFYHDLFVSEQVGAFTQALAGTLGPQDLVADIGGGCGYFAQALHQHLGVATVVIDMDPASVAACTAAGIPARLSDALAPAIAGDETITAFNMVLHHLIGHDEGQTRDLQKKALVVWRQQVRHVFVNEYIYESFVFPRLSSWLIWSVTSSRLLSQLAKAVSRFVPSLRANTFGVGVRFRSADDWRELFDEAGYEVLSSYRGVDDAVSWARRMMLIRSGRRDSFLLKSKPATA